MKSLKAALFASAFVATAVPCGIAMAQDAAPMTREQKQMQTARMRGVYAPDLEAFVANRDPAVQPFYRALYSEGERNAVLNFNRIGLVEMQRHHFKDAAYAFDQAANRIDAIYANDPNAQKAKSLWTEEGVKDYKGEPYERAMTFYYRGVLKLMVNDYDNARANFKAAEQQTMMSESETYKTSGFAALTFLAGWASHCGGDENQAATYYSDAMKANVNLKLPAASDNLLVIGEVGVGPTKAKLGQYGEQLHMMPSARNSAYTQYNITGPAYLPPAPVMPISDIVAAPAKKGKKGAKAAALTPAKLVLPPPTPDADIRGLEASDISIQSTTRDGRKVDVILKGKAQFKDTAQTVGTVATTVGTSMMAFSGGNSAMGNMGAGFALFGIVADIAAAAANPAADIRYWDTLPGDLDFATGVRRQGDRYVRWSVVGPGGAPMRAPEQMYVSTGGTCSVAWARDVDLSAAPGSSPGSAYPGRFDNARLARDASFRAGLSADFSTTRDVPEAAPGGAGVTPVATTVNAAK